MEHDSLKVFLKEQILSAFKVAFSNMVQKSAILITDDVTTNILDTCLKVHQLNDLGIGAIVNVKFNRERVQVPPIYFLSSNDASLKAVIEDYANPEKPQYASSAHLFMLPSLTEGSWELLKKSNLRRHLKTLQEVYCNFHALESRVFHFNRPGAFRSLYMTSKIEAELQESAEQLFNVCVSLQEYPYIRYYRDSKNAHVLAQKFESYFAKKKAEMPQFKHNERRSTLIILDRTQDPVAPLLHEITYQAMIKDLVTSETKFIPLESTKEDGTTETTQFYYADDPMWLDFKDKNLPDFLKDLQSKFASFKETNVIAKVKLEEQKENKNLLRQVRNLPKYRKMTNSFNSHFDIKDKLVGLYRSLDLKTIADMEQSLVTGLDENGRNSKLKDIQKQMSTVFKDPTVNSEVKLRLLLIYIISQGGINEKSRNALFTAANLSKQEADAIYNIRSLGVTIKSEKKTAHKPPFWNDMHNRAKALSKSTIVQSRYEPLVATLLKKFDKSTLSESDFPFCGDEAGNKSITGVFGGRSLRRRERSKAGSARGKARIIVFIIGGVCWSEIRECYVLSQELKRDIFVGSSHVMSPKEYINLLMGQEKKGDTIIEVKEDDDLKL